MKSLGQNFLIDANIARRIVDLADIRPDETVLEIGPGRGALTGMLCERAAHVVAVEIDEEVATTLRDRDLADNLTIVREDVLKSDLRYLGDNALPVGARVEKWPVVGNLPYVIGSRLMVSLVIQARSVDRVTFMVQLEVGDRLLADAGSRTYGLLSVMLQATGELRRGFTVPPQAFRPVPKVTSLVLTWRSAPPDDLDIPALLTTVKAAFAHRRKRLSNSLRSLARKGDLDLAREVLLACDAAGVDPGARAEQLSPEQFIALSRELQDRGAVGRTSP